MSNHYKILRLAVNASQAEIKQAYREIALTLHPDMHDGCKTKTDHFKEASEAYRVLSNIDTRRRYDLESGLKAEPVKRKVQDYSMMDGGDKPHGEVVHTREARSVDEKNEDLAILRARGNVRTQLKRRREVRLAGGKEEEPSSSGGCTIF